jgi:hypothetical protein
MKNCFICKLDLPEENYHKNKRNSDGLCYYCKDCRSTMRKQKTYERTIENTKCNMCKELKPADQFHSDKSSINGLQGYCKECTNIRMQNYYDKGGLRVFMVKIFRHLRKNAERRNIPVEIDLQYLLDLYENQKGLCALSGIKMDFKSYKSRDKQRTASKHNISPDRIDPSKGYVPGNVQLVCAVVNAMKWDYSQDDFIEMCKIITYRNSK